MSHVNRSEIQSGNRRYRRLRQRLIVTGRPYPFAIGVSVTRSASLRDNTIPRSFVETRLRLQSAIDLDHLRNTWAVVNVHELGHHLLGRKSLGPPAHFGYRCPAQPESFVVQTGIAPCRAEYANGFSFPYSARCDVTEGRFYAPSYILIIGQVVREKEFFSLHRGINQLSHSQLIFRFEVPLFTHHSVNNVGREHSHMLGEQGIFPPNQYPATTSRCEVARSPDEFDPLQAAEFRSVRFIAFRADSCVINLVS